MGKFDGILLCTDLDGTLFRNDKTISRENIEAIEYFKREGGYFTFVTGRMPFFVSDVLEAVKPNAPFGCVNGAGVFDGEKQEYVCKTIMSEQVLELVEHADQSFSDLGIQVNTFERTYFSRENETMKNFRRRTKLENLVCPYHEVKEPIAKIVFGSEIIEDIQRLEQILKAHPLAEDFDFIRSEKNLYEILSKGCCKGTAIKNLCAYLQVDVAKSIAIGDYNNDISMFEAAGVGIAVSNACREALDAADFVTVSNEENAIAKVISDLEDGKYQI